MSLKSQNKISYTKPSITSLEVAYATDAAENGWGENCYDYINKFETLTKFILDEEESKRFLNDVQNLRNLAKSELHKLNIKVKSEQKNSIFQKAIF